MDNTMHIKLNKRKIKKCNYIISQSTMKFCTKCDNMYYISISEKDSNVLSYYCRSCGHVDDTLTEEGVCILDTQLKKGKQKFNHIINEYTKMDPTLPRIYNIPCPNTLCSTHGSKSTASASASSSVESSASQRKDEVKQSEVIYMRYDDTNLKYIYICTTCDTVWKTDDA